MRTCRQIRRYGTKCTVVYRIREWSSSTLEIRSSKATVGLSNTRISRSYSGYNIRNVDGDWNGSTVTSAKRQTCVEHIGSVGSCWHNGSSNRLKRCSCTNIGSVVASVVPVYNVVRLRYTRNYIWCYHVWRSKGTCRCSGENNGIVVIGNVVGTFVDESTSTVELSRYGISCGYLEGQRRVKSVIKRNVV